MSTSAPPDPMYRSVDEPAIHGATCTVAVEPTRPIEGFVRDAQTKQPIPGAIVAATSLSGSRSSIDAPILARTDAQGHYRLIGLPKEVRHGT